MCRKALLVVLVLGSYLTSSAYAATIIWVSDNKNFGTAAADQGWVNALRAAGHTVDYRGEGGSSDADYRYWRTIDAGKIAELNAADLIIVSRDLSSGQYDDEPEVTQWNSQVTTPLILQIAHLARQQDWNWLNSTSTSSTTANMSAEIPKHFVFTGVTLDANNEVNILASGDADVGSVTDAGNGTVIGTRADTGAVWIAEWEPGVEFYPGSGQSTGGPRMWFAGGGSPDGLYNFNAEGEKIFLNAVLYMLGGTDKPGQASDPMPADQEDDVRRDAALSWTPGDFAPATNGHTVYISENFTDVNDGVGGITVSAVSYDPGRLDFGTTYYWRVDEVNGPPDNTVHPGEVWSFSTEPVGYPIANVTATASSSAANQGPANTVVDGSGLSDNLHSAETETMWVSGFGGPQPTWIQFEFDKVYVLHEMWVWNSNTELEDSIGFGFKDVTIEHSLDGVDYATLGTTHEFARATGMDGYAHNTTVDFGGLQTKYVRLTANSSWGGFLPQFGLSEVRFLHIPLRAREPYPELGAADAAVDATLGWRAGREAAEHDVYFSTDEQAVIDDTAPVTVVTEANYGPLSLDLDQTYFWRIDEVNAAETPAMLPGDVWSFTTQEFLVADDFEAYNDIAAGEEGSNPVYSTWIDGFDNPSANGSTIGYVEAFQPSMETAIVHGGEQSVPLMYNNSAASSSEVTVDPANLSIGRDWTVGSPQTLVLWFHGSPGNAVTERMYVKLNGAKVAYPGDAADIAEPRWKQWNIDLAAFGVSLSNVTELGIGFERTGAIGGTGTVFIDDILLYRSAPEIVVPAEEIWIEAEATDTITEPMMVYDDPAASGGKYIGTTEDIGNSSGNPPAPDGVASYTFAVAGGTYKITGRINIPSGNNSFWVRIQGATTPADTELHTSGWVRWNDPPATPNW
ncbi:MAG: discoidin domain-containing protein, partial [Planctomycetota bacterium]